MKRDPVYVARPSLPPLEEVLPYLEQIWDTRILSNNGPLLQQFETALAAYLGVEHLSFVANATLGTVLAMQQAGLTEGEVITTPFSFVATAHAIRQAGCDPVFADIDPVTLNLDPAQVERLITPRTRAILPVHVFGTPCDTEALADIARRHNLRLIYDAAHAFGVREADGGSVLRHGDMSVLSFHATKVFNTFEGGAVISHDRETKLGVDRLAAFGMRDAVTVEAIGTNAKMTEFAAAVGMAQLGHIDDMLARRAAVAHRYQAGLSGVTGLHCPGATGQPGHNHYAFPVMVGPDYPLSRDALDRLLQSHDIFARRYFYPLISEFEVYRDLPSSDPARLPHAQRAASRVLCLPMYPSLPPEVQDEIIALVARPCG